MAKLNANLDLKSLSNTNYNFQLYTTDNDFKESWGGVYFFSKRTPNDKGSFSHTVVYIGKAVNFNQRFDSHEKWEAAKKLGANCIGILKVDKENDMLKIEEDLIKGQKPQLNIVHNS